MSYLLPRSHLLDGNLPLKRKGMCKKTHPWINNEVLLVMRAHGRARKTSLTGTTISISEIKLQSCSGKQEETTFQQNFKK